MINIKYNFFMPKKIFAANWKMNKNIKEATKFINGFVETIHESSLQKSSTLTNKEIIICASFTLLPVLHELNKNHNYKIGAQNMFHEEQGAYTGEISPLHLKDVGCEYVIIGHSERRQYFGETNEIINIKIQSALKHNLIPIFCVGETLAQRENNETKKIITTQIQEGLKDIKLTTNDQRLVIAYEPIWAIGTGKVATAEQAQEVHALIHALTNKNTSILYGGSVKPDNVKELMAQPDINGALVGGASLEIESFAKIII